MSDETENPEIFPTRVPWGSVAAFFVIACGLAWLVALPLWLRGRGLTDPLFKLLSEVMMYTPAIAALAVVFFLQKPRPRRIGEYLGLWPLRPARRTVWMCVIAIFGTALLVIAGVFVAAALGQIKLDLVHFSGFRESLGTALKGAPARASSADVADAPVGLIITLQVIAIPFAAIIPNSLVTIGEELGWRGWLLPTLRPLGTWPALLLSGAIWGFWHTPIILLGYDFGLTNGYGVLLMIAASMILGTLIGWLRLRTASIWPSVFAHGALNAVGGVSGLVVAAGDHPSPVSAGPLGWAAWIVMAVVITVLALTGQFRKQPRLKRQPKPAGVIEF